MNTEAIAKAARLDVEGWLDTGTARKANDLACSIHADLASFTGGHMPRNARELFVQRINGHANAVLGIATHALSVLQDPRVTYALKVPADDHEPASLFAGTFVDVNFIDPLAALKALREIRSESPALQMAAIRLLEAEAQALQASQAVGMAFLSASDREDFWPEGIHDELPGLSVGEPPGERRLSSRDREEASRIQAQRHLYKAERAVSKLSETVPDHLRRLCAQALDALQAQGNQWAPLAIALPQDIEHGRCSSVALGYSGLAWTLDIGTSLEITGAMKRPAMAARRTLEGCVSALKVLAGWIRALGELQASPRCEFCHRHRATKKRCAVHSVKEYITKEARVAVATHPLYVEHFTALARVQAIQRVLKASLQVDADARSAAEMESHALRIHKALVTQACTLAVQLRRLRPVFGQTLEGEVALLFQKLLSLAAEAHRRPPGRTSAEQITRLNARNASKALLTLRGFLIAWCSTGRPFPRSFPALAGAGHDAAHPVVREQPLIESEIALGFLRQRAWFEAEAELRRHTEIDRENVMEMRDRGMSFDAIAAVHGCSHDTIVKIVARGEAPRKRARLAGYLAKSRLRVLEQ
jgi:hypothetical protein